MATIKVKTSPELDEAIEYLIKRGLGKSSEEIILKAITYFGEEFAAEEVMENDMRDTNKTHILAPEGKKILKHLAKSKPSV